MSSNNPGQSSLDGFIRPATPAIVPDLPRTPSLLFIYLFIYLFILHTAWSPKAIAGIERKDNNISSKTDVQKQGR